MRTRRGLVVLLAAAVLLLPNLATVSVRAASPGVNGLIAFERGTDWETDIWLMAPDGSGQMVVPGVSAARDPALSPDGSKLAFAGWGSGPVNVVNVDGSDWHELTGGMVWDPAWSPDGARIAYGEDDWQDYRLTTVLADGTGPVRVLGSWGDFPTSPVWSPDGTTITLGGHDDLTGASFVERVNADGIDRSRIVTLPPGEWVSGVTLSPDGAQIAYGLRLANEIWVVDPDGSDPHYLAAGVEPSWSPDGTKIAYTCGDHICVMDADGTGSIQLTTEGVNRDPFWGNTGAVTYDFTGFFAPVDNDKLNVAKAGSAIPVKFSLGGDQGLDIFAAGYPKAVAAACEPGEVPDTIETYAAGASGLQYDPVTDMYTYVWKTQKAWKGCYEFQMKLADGSEHVAQFKFK